MSTDLDRIRQWRQRMAPRVRLAAQLEGDGGMVAHFHDVTVLLAEIDRRDAILRYVVSLNDVMDVDPHILRQAKELVGDA